MKRQNSFINSRMDKVVLAVMPKNVVIFNNCKSFEVDFLLSTDGMILDNLTL